MAQLTNRCVCGNVEPDATPTWHCPVHGGPLEQRTDIPEQGDNPRWDVLIDGKWVPAFGYGTWVHIDE